MLAGGGDGGGSGGLRHANSLLKGLNCASSFRGGTMDSAQARSAAGIGTISFKRRLSPFGQCRSSGRARASCGHAAPRPQQGGISIQLQQPP